jgi:hypothetical protein
MGSASFIRENICFTSVKVDISDHDLSALNQDLQASISYNDLSY